MAKEAEEGVEDLKELGAMAAKILDLTDIIFGSLILYLVHAWNTSNKSFEPTKVFPSTGHTFIDIGLLACAAAFAGKLLTLTTHTLMALTEILFERTKRYKALNGIVSRQLRGTPMTGLEKDPIDLAVDLVAATDSKLADKLREIE